jgi:hypothetical protein
VVEANALRYSPVGQLLLNCLESTGRDGSRSPLDVLRAAGIEPLRDVDRVAMGDVGLVASGNFSQARWDELLGPNSSEPYGTSGQIHTLPNSGDGGPVVATWNSQLVLFAPSREAGLAMLDRLDGRGPVGQLLSDDQAYGDVYGVIGSAALGAVLTRDNSPLGAQLREAVSSIDLHVDATRDVGLVATLSGDDTSRLQDLGATLGGALAVARAEAVATGDAVTAQLLEAARVIPNGSTFQLELAIPLETFQGWLAFCGRKEGDAGR